MAVEGSKASGVGKKSHRPKSVTNTKTKTKRISPKAISNFKNKETTQASKANLTLNTLERRGKKSNKITFRNNLKNPTIKVDVEALTKPKTAKEAIKVQKSTINKKKPARFTPGLPTVSRNKVGKGIVGQQTREILRYQRQAHGRILQGQNPKAGYISPGKGGFPSHTAIQKGKSKPAITATGVGVKKAGKPKKK